jgi:hypothetical protein
MNCMNNTGDLKAKGMQMIETKKDKGKEKMAAPVSPLTLMYKSDTNILVASWVNDLGYKQAEQESKALFYNSEQMLNKGDVIEHFQKRNRLKFAHKNV